MRDPITRGGCYGFTLTEVMITVVIVAALAGLAIPNYTKTIEVARSQEAKGDLQQIYQGQRIYKLNNASYWIGGVNPTVDAVNTALKTSLKADYYDVSSITGDSSVFSAIEQRRGCPAKTFTIDQSGSVLEGGDYCT